MKKFAFKLTLMLGIMLGVSNYMMYIMTGKSPLSFSLSNFTKPSSGLSIPNVQNMIPAGKERAYKWTDANGVVHYSSEAPAGDEAVELLDVDPNTNLVQGLQVTADAPEEKPATEVPTTVPSGNVYNPDTIKKLIDDAKSVQDTLNKRYEDMEGM